MIKNGAWRRNLKFQCTGCGKCCRETVVLVTDVDVRRLMENTGLAAKEIVRFFKPEEFVMEKRHPFWIQFDSGPAVMGLRWNSGQCRFLGVDDRCGVYDARPVTCREYPFSVVQDSDGAFQSLEIEHVVECPGTMDGSGSLREIRAVIRWNEEQSATYVQKVRSWNRLRLTRRTRPAFLEHVSLGGPGDLD